MGHVPTHFYLMVGTMGHMGGHKHSCKEQRMNFFQNILKFSVSNERVVAKC